jgi:catechol 2,3-dioxygenase-like lactoylglutathione lyase family enzyme
MGNILVQFVGMTVADMDRSIDFYTNVLQFQKVSDHERKSSTDNDLANQPIRVVKMQLGNELIELTEYLSEKGRSIPEDSRSNDGWFQHLAIVVKDMEQAYQHLVDHEVLQVSSSPQTIPKWNIASGNIQEFYFKDPDGHNLELICFPQGKGDPRWQDSSESMFLGIDHTAIVVGSTDVSRAFYCDVLGLVLQQDSKNVGLEQERLSNLPRVQMRLSSLKARSGMGIELLEYLNPRPGRFIPANTAENDLWFSYTTIAVKDLKALRQELKEVKSLLYCSEIQVEGGGELACLVKDPDGHRIRVVEK